MRTLSIVLALGIITIGTYNLRAQGKEPSDAAAAEPGSKAPKLKSKKSSPAAEATTKTRSGKLELESVLRGFYMSLSAGIGFIPREIDNTRYIPGGDFGVLFGFDISDLLSVQAQIYWNSFGCWESSQTPDLMMYGGRLALLFSLWHSKQTWVQAGAGVGILWMDDALTVPYKRSVAAHVLGGLEYYTKLRHFSVGIDLDVQFLFISPFNLNIQLLPHIRYTF